MFGSGLVLWWAVQRFMVMVRDSHLAPVRRLARLYRSTGSTHLVRRKVIRCQFTLTREITSGLTGTYSIINCYLSKTESGPKATLDTDCRVYGPVNLVRNHLYSFSILSISK